MPLSVFNSLSGKKEIFTPIDEKNVRMYVCGPTVYDRAHLGNARAVVVFDMFYRLLHHAYGKQHVTYVRNITDVDDKINKAAKERGIAIENLTEETTRMFHSDMAQLGCLEPNIEPKATQHIGEMIQMVQQLVDSDHAYANEGHVLFHVQTYDGYGRLSNRSRDEMIAGARVEVAPYKKDPADFVLWKPSNDDEPGWQSPWGRGRPGWHLECSAMSGKYLGKTFDIHGGGADLKFPHHENEIAQSCSANGGVEYVNYWVHNGFLSVDGEKMSKSLGNFITVHDLLEKGIFGEIIRFALLSSHYRKPLDWNNKVLYDAYAALTRFHEVLEKNSAQEQPVPEAFIEALNDDLGISKAVALLHSYAAKNDASSLKAAAQFMGILQQPVEAFHASLQQLDQTTREALGLASNNIAVSASSGEIEELLAQRTQARKNKDWATSDSIRDKLKALGVTIKDNPDGTTSWH